MSGIRWKAYSPPQNHNVQRGATLESPSPGPCPSSNPLTESELLDVPQSSQYDVSSFQFVNNGDSTSQSTFRFIDEQARKQPKSSLRTVVRSHARSYSHKSSSQHRQRRTSGPSRRVLMKAPEPGPSKESDNEEDTSINSCSVPSIQDNHEAKTSSPKAQKQNRVRDQAPPRKPSKAPRTKHHSPTNTRRADLTCLASASHRKSQATLPKLRVPRAGRSRSPQRQFRMSISKSGQSLIPLLQGFLSPKTILGAGRIDPFASYPIDAKPYMHYLVDYCKKAPRSVTCRKLQRLITI